MKVNGDRGGGGGDGGCDCSGSVDGARSFVSRLWEYLLAYFLTCWSVKERERERETRRRDASHLCN